MLWLLILRQWAGLSRSSQPFLIPGRELGIRGAFFGQSPGMSQPGVGYVVNRGEKIGKEKNDQGALSQPKLLRQLPSLCVYSGKQCRFKHFKKYCGIFDP